MAAYGSAILLAVGPIGQVLRDRSVATALLMYIPLPLVGAVAVAPGPGVEGTLAPSAFASG